MVWRDWYAVRLNSVDAEGDVDVWGLLQFLPRCVEGDLEGLDPEPLPSAHDALLNRQDA